MHDDTLPIDEARLRRAIAEAGTRLARQPLRPLAHQGTETRLYRLGRQHLLRLPMRATSLEGVAAGASWLPALAPHLPIAVPRIVARGYLPGDPALPCCLQTWIEGVDAAAAPIAEPDDLADRLAECLMALRTVPVPPDPPQGPRGGALMPQDVAFRQAEAAAAARGMDGLGPAIDAWELGLAAAPWTGAPLWLHGDLVPGNLILSNGRLTALIDWSFVTVGDPAYDLIPAWFLFEGRSRARFLSALEADAATIARARARVAWQCVLALPHYIDTNPAMVRLARDGLARLADGGP